MDDTQTASPADAPYEVVEFDTKEQWLDARRGLVTGSDAGPILGLHETRTAFNVFAGKKGIEPALDEDMWQLRRGRALEPELADVFSKRTKRKLVVPWSKPFGILVSRKYPWLAHTIDRAVVSTSVTTGSFAPGGIEAGAVEVMTDGWEGKSTRGSLRYRWGDYTMPDEYYMQNTVGLIVTGFPRWFLTVAIGDDEPRDYETAAPDPAFEAAVLERLEQFWARHIRDGIPPDLDGSEAARLYLRQKFPKNLGSYIGVAGEIEHQVLAYRDILAREKALEELKATIQNKLIAVIGDHDGLEGEWGRIHYKLTKSAPAWKEAAAKLHGDFQNTVALLRAMSEHIPLSLALQDIAHHGVPALDAYADASRGEDYRKLNPKFKKETD